METAFLVVRLEKSRSSHAFQGVSYFPGGRIYKTFKAAEKESNRLHKLYSEYVWHLGTEVREIPFPWDR